MSGKGDSPRNVGPKFKENYDSIDWRKKPDMVIDALYIYKDKQYRYLGKSNVQGVEFYQLENYPNNDSGIYLDEYEVKDLKPL